MLKYVFVSIRLLINCQSIDLQLCLTLNRLEWEHTHTHTKRFIRKFAQICSYCVLITRVEPQIQHERTFRI